jgi:hypothetical protein
VQVLTAQDFLRSQGIDDLATAEIETLAAFPEQADHLISVVREARGNACDQLVVVLDRRAKGTVRVDGFKITVPSAEAGTHAYEPELLAAALGRLVESGVIDQEAVDDAIEMVRPQPYHKPKIVGVKRLLRLGGDVQAAIEKTRIEKPPPRRTATVKREALHEARDRASGGPARARTPRKDPAGRLPVVGTFRYEAELRQLAPSGNALLPAALIPEPTNPHDPFAVMVLVDGRCVGYMSRAHAGRFHARLSRLLAAGESTPCTAMIERDADDESVVWLGLPLHIAL